MRRTSWLVTLSWMLIVTAGPIGAAQVSYRDVASPPLPDQPPVPGAPPAPNAPPVPGLPPNAPNPPCTVVPFTINCDAGGNWATEAVPTWAIGAGLSVAAWAGALPTFVNTQLQPWADGQVDATEAWQGDAQNWATAEFGPWASAAPGRAATDEFVFLGNAGTTSATIHVHDALPGTLHSNVVFTVKGGPGGEMWICEHTCTIPDTGFTVSVDPNDVPNNVWTGFDDRFVLPNVPPLTGIITVAFT